MLFNSISFLVFLSVVIPLYWHLGDRYRRILLLLSSLVFYGFWRVDFIPLILFSISVDYVAARLLSKETNARKRRSILFASVFINLSILGFFKYTIFILENLNGLAPFFGIDEFSLTWKIILPIGISFYTFQSISYTVDVYRGIRKAEKSFLLLSNYVLFFPQLVAGPILRASEVMDQLRHRPEKFKLEYLVRGVDRILIGLFLKVALADNIGVLSDSGFAAAPDTLTPIDVFVIATLFGLQIYFDFAGYSHIAIGVARLMGIEFPENFNHPYTAINPKEFWKRWHISLSSWVRDYLYLPLCNLPVGKKSVGGLSDIIEEKGGRKLMAVPLVFSWAVMGLWHGAAWGFVLWGLWHASLVLIYRAFFGNFISSSPISKLLSWAFFMPLIMLGWIPFRAQTIEKSTDLFQSLLSFSSQWDVSGNEITIILGLSQAHYMVAICVFTAVVLMGLMRPALDTMKARSNAFLFVSVAKYAAMTPFIFVYLNPVSQFIYFQF